MATKWLQYQDRRLAWASFTRLGPDLIDVVAPVGLTSGWAGKFSQAKALEVWNTLVSRGYTERTEAEASAAGMTVTFLKAVYYD